MCLYPKKLIKRGKYKETNYRGQQGDTYSISTYSKCGSCSQCLAEKANNWVIRNHYEAKATERKCFITLTYEKHPFFLVRKDLTDFIKRFRYKINENYYKALKEFEKKIKDNENKKELITQWKEEHAEEFIKTRLFYAGEYGTAKGRPHFHVIIYGWDDKQAYFIGLNKKINCVYQSKIIQECWKLGRTSYQSFGDNEAPYIALYNTSQETFKNAYKLSRQKIKQIYNKIESTERYLPPRQKKNLLEEMAAAEKELNEQKKQYLLIKEFNGWSLALGWEEFLKEYTSQNKYAFEEYIGENIFATCSPWVKKLANMGDLAAAEEMFRREQDQIKQATEAAEKGINEKREGIKRKKEVIEWQEGRKNEVITDF